MTDHLAEARADLDRLEACNQGSWLASAVAHILDHLEAAQTDASIRRGLADAAAGRTEYLGRFADDEPDPLDEDNHDDRYDRDGDRWVWCDDCDGLRLGARHEAHAFAYGWSAVELDKDYGPLTFTPRPADTPTTAPQPDEAHGDVPDPDRPNLNAKTTTATLVTPDGIAPITVPNERWNIRAEAWEEGWRTGYADGAHYDDPRITPNPYRKDRA